MSDKIDMTKIQIRGPAVDALDQRKEADCGPSETQVTTEATAHFRKFGPREWPKELLDKVYKMGRERS